MRKLFRITAIVVTTVVLTIVSLAIIGFARGPRTARAARTPTPNPAPQPAAQTPAAAPAPIPQATTPTTPAKSAQPATAATPTSEPVPRCAEVRKLNDLESQGKDADAALAIFTDAPSLSPQDRTEVIAWLKDRVKPGRIPAAYWIARLHFANNDLTQAANWYAAAALSGRIDAARLSDKSAASAVPALEVHFADIKKVLAADATLRRAASAWAIDFEESTKDRAPANWIAAHGLAYKGAAPATIADDQWQIKRQAQRDAWKNAQ